MKASDQAKPDSLTYNVLLKCATRGKRGGGGGLPRPPPTTDRARASPTSRPLDGSFAAEIGDEPFMQQLLDEMRAHGLRATDDTYVAMVKLHLFTANVDSGERVPRVPRVPRHKPAAA